MTAEGEVTADKSEIYSDDESTAYILADAPDMGSLRSQNLYITAYDPNTDPEAYTKAYKKISEMVYTGEGKIATMRVIGADYSDGINADTASIVYDELVRYKRAAEARKIKGAPKDVEGRVSGRGLGKVDAESRIFLEEFAKSFKVDINVVDDTGDGSLGSTNPLSRRITLSIKSANELSTLLHESGHIMKAWDPDTFYAIQDAVCDWFAKYNNTTLEDLIEMRQAEYTEKEGKPCSYQEAKDEVTCNAIEAIQTAENFAEEFTQTMADLQYPKAEAEEKLTALQKFFRKIKLALNNIIARLKNKRGGNLMITAEGKVISKDVAMVNDLLKKVRQGLVNVRTNYDAYVAGAEVKSAGDGAIRHMYDGDVRSWNIDWDTDNFSDIKNHIRKHLEELNSMEIVTSVTYKHTDGKNLSEKLNEILKNRFGYKISTQNYGTILFDPKAIDKAINYVNNDAEAAALISAPYVLKRGKAISGHKNHKNKGWPSVTFAAPVELNGVRGNVGVAVLYGGKNRIHAVRVLTPNGKVFNLTVNKDTESTSVGSTSKEGVGSTINSVSNDIISKTDPIVNTNSSTDSDTELKQHISSEAEEQAKADELDALREENKALKAMDKRRWQMIDYLQKQLDQWKRGGKKLDYRGIEKLARSLIKEYGAKVDVKAYAKELTSFFNYMTNNPKPSADIIKKRYTELAEKLIHNVEEVNPEVQEQLKNIRHIIRDGIVLNVNKQDVRHCPLLFILIYVAA